MKKHKISIEFASFVCYTGDVYYRVKAAYRGKEDRGLSFHLILKEVFPMKNIKRVFSILLAVMMLLAVAPMTVSAEGTQDNPINANDKWFGYGVDCFLMNTTLEAGDADGVWYELTADQAGILQVEHKYYDVDYQIVVNVNGREYLGYESNIYNLPIATLPVAVGDVISIHVIAQDTTQGGTVYCNAKFISGENDITQMVKLKGVHTKVWVAAGQTVHFQDDSLNADYAAKGLLVESPEDVGGKGVTVISGGKNYTDTDGDGFVELMLGGSAGSAGAPPVKPSFAIVNESGQDSWFRLWVNPDAHECEYAHAFATTCTKCGAERLVDIRPLFAMTGSSKSEDVNGIAFKYDVKVDGMEVNGTTAIYDNATVEGFKLIGMGAVVSNTDAIRQPTLEDVDGIRVVDVPAMYLCNLYDEYEDTVSFAVRIKNIPDEHKDTTIWFCGYFIVEIDGTPTIFYDNGSAGAYSWF